MQELEIKINYLPLPKQNRFHLSEAKFRLYIGAWRAGKSYAGCYEAYKQSFLYPGNVGLIGRKDFTDLRDTTMKTFFEVVPEDFIRSYNKTEHHVVFKNGSEIYFRELKDGKGLGSLNLGWFYVDEAEEIEETIFERLKGRLSLAKTKRQCGWLTSNPPNEDHWLYKQFEKSHDPDFGTFHASTYENKPNLPDGYIESLEKLPPSWRKKYLEGQYGFTPDGTPYYNGYMEHIHKRDLALDPYLPIQCGWDFGRRHPAFIVTQIAAPFWNIHAEILGSDISLRSFATNHVVPLLESRFRNLVVMHFGDPACNQVSDKEDLKGEFTSYQILLSLGILVRTKYSEYAQRKEIIEQKINTMHEGVPLLGVSPSCRIINDGFLGGYHYPTLESGQQFNFRKDAPFKDGFYEHPMNALEYVAVNCFSPTKSAGRREPNLQYATVDNV